MKKKVRVILIVAAFIVATVLVIRMIVKSGEDGAMKLSGNIEVTESNVGFKIPGRIVRLLVDEGAVVKAGDCLAVLDSGELEKVVSQQTAILGEAETRLGELRAGSRPQEIGQAQASVIASEAELTRTKKDFDRAQVLFENGAISAAQYDGAKSLYESRKASFEGSADRLSLVREGPRQEDIRAGAYRVEQARSALGVAEKRLADTRIHAPMDGVVLRKNVEVGETVGAGTPVFTIGNLMDPWVKVYVKEDKLGLVRLGQKASVTVDSLKNRSFDGTVTFVSSEAEFTPKTVQTDEERVKLVFGIKVKVANPGGELKPGMPADVRIPVK